MRIGLCGRLARAALVLWIGLTAAFAVEAAAPAGSIESIVIKYRDEALSPAANVLPDYEMYALASALRSGFAVTGRSRDGAFQIALNPPLPLDEARAALNRVRMDSGILYANVTPGPATRTAFLKSMAPGLPTDRIIVKYKDPAQVDATRHGAPLSQDQVDRLSTLIGQVVAFLRGTADGGNVLEFLQRLPVAQMEAIAAIIAAQPDVEYAQPDYIRTAKLQPTDPCYASASSGACSSNFQWDLFDPVGGINMPTAWNFTTGAAGIKVGVIDTGALFNHPDLAGRLVGGYDMIEDCAVANDSQPSTCTFSRRTGPDFLSRDSDASDPGDWISQQDASGRTFGGWFIGCPVDSSSFHGTHVAGTIGAIANNGIGIAGINWVSQIVPVRVLGKCGGYVSDITDGMVWAAGGSVPGLPANPNPVRVMNLSLGGTGSCSAAEQNAVNSVLSHNAVVVVAAGNESANASTSSPGNCSGVITVAATTRSGARAFYSNYGTSVEIAAPGGSADGSDNNILSTLNSGSTSPSAFGYNYVNYAGTSMATPHVTGVVSLLLSSNPSLTPSQVLATLQNTARAFPAPGPACPAPDGSGLISVRCNCTTSLCGAGILDAGAALASIAGTPTTTTLATSGSPANAGNTVTFTATVNGNLPTGTVGFTDNGATISGCGAVALSGGGNSPTAQCATSTLTAGSHNIVATYAGSPPNAGSTSSTLVQVIKAVTTTALASSLNPSGQGSSVTFTATVTGSAPTGTVSFTDNGNPLCSSVALTGVSNSRTAVCTTTSLSVGSHPIVATYGGDASNLGSTSNTVSQVVNPVSATTTQVATSGSPSNQGTSVTFTATVTGSTPTGSVSFTNNGAALCSNVALSGSGNQKTAQCATSTLTAGAHTIGASYAGDGLNAGSSGSVQQVVMAVTTTGLASSANPSQLGNTVTFTATVNGALPGGSVTFTDNGNTLCNAVALVGSGNTRTAQCSTNGLAAGAHPISASYSGDAQNLPSTGNLSQQVNQAQPSSTSLASSRNPSAAKQQVTLTATVSGIAPTGTVTFTDNGVVQSGCSNVLLSGSGNARTAQCVTTRLSSGSHPMAANYSGDTANLPSTGTLTQVVN